MYKTHTKKTIKLKAIKDALNKWQDIPFTWMRKFNIVKNVKSP